MSAFRTNIESIVVAKLGWNFWPAPTPIDEFLTDKDSVRLRVVSYVGNIGRSIREAVMGVHLLPWLSKSLVVDVVSECLLFAAS